jgi:hypothetical protein
LAELVLYESAMKKLRLVETKQQPKTLTQTDLTKVTGGKGGGGGGGGTPPTTPS